MTAKYYAPLNPYIEEAGATDDVTGGAIKTGGYTSIGFQSVWTSTLEGTLSLEGSMDGTTWTDLGVTFNNDPAGSADSDITSLASYPVAYIRLVFTHSGGSGDLTVRYLLSEA